MLSNTVLATPRPRPPAKVRRSPSLNFPPPPPYAPRLDVLLDSPIAVTAQLLGSAVAEEPNAPVPVVEEWMNEKSKEELSDLLLKADGLIKSRETELGLTSALCKSLYHDNIALKTKHEALLSRIPSNQTGTPSPPLSSVPISPSPLSQSPHYYSASLPRTPVDSPAPLSPPLPRLRHNRRVSVTPGEIALLADQNAELLDKLEKLEEESDRNDQIGRRKLKKLEKEIQGLKEELEQTQAKELELEEKAKTAFALSEAELQRRKEEREERLRGQRDQSNAESELLDEEVRDFAPAPELPRSGSLRTMPETETSLSPPALNLATKPSFVDDSQVLASTYLPPRSPTPRPEYALISQLLRKIQELEDTNAQINSEQKATGDRLRSAQRDAESIRRAYDYLEDDSTDVRVIDITSPALRPSQSVEETIKFSSLRRTIEGDLEPCMDESDDEDFASGISDEMQSTTRDVLPPPGNKSGNSHKARKSVVGLFDSPESNRQVFSGAAYPSMLEVSPSFRSDSSPAHDLADVSSWSTAAVDSFDGLSPTMSTLGLSVPPNRSGSGTGFGSQRKTTLGSELGSEFGDDWGENAGNYHLRASSLYDLTHITTVSRENTPSPTLDKPLLFHTPTGSPPSDSGWETLDEPPVTITPASVGSATPVRARHLELVVDPPSPSPTKSVRNHPSLREVRSARNLRLSETVRARTNRWVEGRYTESALSVPIRRRRSIRSSGHAGRGSDASMIFSETFDVVVRQLSFNGMAADGELAEEDEDTITGMEMVRSSRTDGNSTAVVLPPRKEGFVGFILEVWLWLQFAIVVMVFLWAMARRGPKSVLKEAEKRKASGSLRR